jgi:hypothetical protein
MLSFFTAPKLNFGLSLGAVKKLQHINWIKIPYNFFKILNFQIVSIYVFLCIEQHEKCYIKI